MVEQTDYWLTLPANGVKEEEVGACLLTYFGLRTSFRCLELYSVKIC